MIQKSTDESDIVVVQFVSESKRNPTHRENPYLASVLCQVRLSEKIVHRLEEQFGCGLVVPLRVSLKTQSFCIGVPNDFGIVPIGTVPRHLDNALVVSLK